MRSVTEEEKIEATEDFQKHLHIYQEHRTFYSSAIKKSHEVLKTNHRKSAALIHLYIHAQRILLSILYICPRAATTVSFKAGLSYLY